MNYIIGLIVMMSSGMSYAGSEELLNAICMGDMSGVQSNIQFLENVKEMPELGPLVRALQSGHEEIARYLLECSPFLAVEHPQSEYEDPVLLAIGLKRYDFALDLIKVGASVNAQIEWAVPASGCEQRADCHLQEIHTPLFLAIMAEHEELVAALLSAGAFVDSPCGRDGQSPLHVAISKGSVSIVRLLLRHGADPEPLVSLVKPVS